MTNLESGRRIPTVDLHGAFIRRTDWSGASLRCANLTGADCSDANFQGVDFMDARLTGTILRGADLSDARNLTIGQLATAIIDERTRLPAYIDRERLITKIGTSTQMEGSIV